MQPGDCASRELPHPTTLHPSLPPNQHTAHTHAPCHSRTPSNRHQPSKSPPGLNMRVPLTMGLRRVVSRPARVTAAAIRCIAAAVPPHHRSNAGSWQHGCNRHQATGTHCVSGRQQRCRAGAGLPQRRGATGGLLLCSRWLLLQYGRAADSRQQCGRQGVGGRWCSQQAAEVPPCSRRHMADHAAVHCGRRPVAVGRNCGTVATAS
jgi:hypothetical protein